MLKKRLVMFRIPNKTPANANVGRYGRHQRADACTKHLAGGVGDEARCVVPAPRWPFPTRWPVLRYRPSIDNGTRGDVLSWMLSHGSSQVGDWRSAKTEGKSKVMPIDFTSLSTPRHHMPHIISLSILAAHDPAGRGGVGGCAAEAIAT